MKFGRLTRRPFENLPQLFEATAEGRIDAAGAYSAGFTIFSTLLSTLPAHREHNSAMKNRSVPADIVLPHLVYRNVTQAGTWLSRVFGFVEHYRYGDPASGIQMHLGPAWIMIT